MSTQSNLNLSSNSSEPVECLGQTFPSNEARRKHYLRLLAEKLKDPEFRKIEGFPIGEDEDILALSDPPYYTACPNPWIGDFIQHYGRSYDPKEKYHREPFAADVSEGKKHPLYGAHSYHTKVPHRAIMRYILHYTEPGDIVFDGFCGTGMTGVASQLCGDWNEVQELGYRINTDGIITDLNGQKMSRIGKRNCVLSDLSPAATFISNCYTTTLDSEQILADLENIKILLHEKCDWMYATNHSNKETGRINYTVWSDVFVCPECGESIIFWDSGIDKNDGSVQDSFPCPKCAAFASKRSAERKWVMVNDLSTGRPIRIAKQVPVLINYTFKGAEYNKSPDEDDTIRIQKIENQKINSWFPSDTIPDGFNTRQPAGSHGVVCVHHFFTARTLNVLANLWGAIAPLQPIWKSVLTGVTQGLSRQQRFRIGSTFPNMVLSGTLYIGSLVREWNAIDWIYGKVAGLRRGRLKYSFASSDRCISTCSAGAKIIPDASCDYIFVDPPFGGNLNYSELNYVWESWLRVWTNNAPEAIQNPVQKKGLSEYRDLMQICFREAYRILKPGRWMTVEFSNTSAQVWNSIQSAMSECGFIVANVAVLDKKQGTFKAITTPTAVKQDLVISAYKPDGGLEDRFKKTGHTVDGVWDFMRTHLRNLPVVKPRGGELEFIAERDPRILYDRMVAFYVGHGVPVPLSSAEFQAALAEKFLEREGMYFLPEQVTEWDKKRSQMQGVGQMSIFVEDEKSAINWIRQYLSKKPCAYNDISPEFMQQLGASWKKFETRPELGLLLEQNFLKYDGKGEVPSQIHSYLSTQNKDLRNLPKDDARLRMRAKDRWYVPDPAKAVDVEAVRNKRLLQEFWDLCTEAGIARPSGPSAQQTLPLATPTTVKKTGRKKLKEVRTEAVRLGFKECFSAKDYGTILAIAAHLPDNVIEEDEQLQMMHDMAEMRAQG